MQQGGTRPNHIHCRKNNGRLEEVRKPLLHSTDKGPFASHPPRGLESFWLRISAWVFFVPHSNSPSLSQDITHIHLCLCCLLLGFWNLTPTFLAAPEARVTLRYPLMYTLHFEMQPVAWTFP